MVRFDIYFVLIYKEYMGKVLSCYDVFMFTHTKDHDGKTFQVNKDKEVHVSLFLIYFIIGT